MSDDAAPSPLDPRPKLERLEYPRLIICEGNSDEAVFKALLSAHQIAEIQLHYTGGRDNFNSALKGARTIGFKRILLISDGDDKPDNSFGLVCDQLTKAGYKKPKGRREVIEPEGQNPGTEILMLPWDKEEGCLETICLPAFEKLYPEAAACVVDLCKCAKIHDTWTKKQLSEMQVQAILSCTQRNPRIGIKYFVDRTACPLDFKHDCFKPLVSYLREFSQRSV